MASITQLSVELQAYLETTADALGRSSGFIQRERNWSGGQFARSLIFGWLGNSAASLSELSQSAANVGVRISRQGLANRFNPQAAAFMQQLVEAAAGYLWQGQACRHPLLKRFERIYLYDSTQIALPDALAAVWAGNSQAAGNQAALKISVRWEMRRGQVEVELQPGRAHDASSTLLDATLETEALRLADLGYFKLDAFAAISASGAYWLSRYRVAVGVAHPDGTPFELVPFLHTHAHPTVDCPILLGQQHSLACRLIAERVPAAVHTQRLQSLRDWSRRTGRPLSPERVALAAWSVWVTNIPLTLLTAPQVATLTTYRWQIELLFKLWKSHLRLDTWRTRNPWRILCEIYAKLIAALLFHALALLADGHAPQRSLFQMVTTIRHFAWRLAATLLHPPRFRDTVHALCTCLTHGAQVATSRSHPRTHQRLLASLD